MGRRIVGLAGSLSKPSRTRALVEAAIETAMERYWLEGEVFDLLSFPSLGSAARLADLDPARRVVNALLNADALVLASPVYKGSYSGLFKHCSICSTLFRSPESRCCSGRPAAGTGMHW